MAVSIVLTDDHPVVRSGYRRLISLYPGMEVVAEFDDGEGTYAWFREHSADVLIMDVSMPGQGGLETLRKIRSQNDQVKIIMLSMHDSPSLVQQAMGYGANGFLSKTSEPEELIDSIPRALHGIPVVSRGVQQQLRGQRPQALPHESLSPKEFTVLLKLAEGLSAREVADKLCLSDKTVYNYQTKIYRKLGVDNGVQLTQYVQMHGLLK
jgi:DNA-binding NarL/FixJ family response regulator